MIPIPDALAGFYLFCFAVGFLFVVASLLLGFSHEVLHIPGLGGDGGFDHGALDGGGHGAGGTEDGSASGHGIYHHGGEGLSPFNVTTITAFVAWFGGVGYVVRVYGGAVAAFSLGIAVIAGLVGGGIIFYLMAKVLLPGQRFLDEGEFRIEGTVAHVSIPVVRDEIGEIVYTMGGTRRSDGAKSADGSRIERGTEVVVVKYEKGIAYVEPWSSYLARG